MIQALKGPSFFRPASRPSSPISTSTPRTETTAGLERAPRPLNRLSLNNFRRSSPAPSPAHVLASATLVQDGSYLEALGLKLSEAVSKSLVHPTGPATPNEQLFGRRPIPAGRGHALGALIASELKATRDNPHLHRAIIRSLHRPLSVLITNLSTHLLPLISSSTFLSPATPTQQSPNLNPAQLHAVALATFTGEILETFDELGLGLDNGDVRGDGLKAVREGLVSVINRVVNPLVGAIKSELVPLLEALETPNTSYVTSSPKGVVSGKSSVVPHPSIVTLQGVMPMYAKALLRYTATLPTQTTLTTFLISVVWRGVVALAHRPASPLTPPASPVLPASPISSKKQRRPSSAAPSTPPAGRFTIKLPPSRPPSPPSVPVPATAAADARALYDLLNLLPRPTGEQETTRLAREAVDEAFDGLKALAIFLEAVQTGSLFKEQGTEAELHDALDTLTEDLPTLIALPVLLRCFSNEGAAASRTVPAMLSFTEEEYRRGCLAGFGRAEECGSAVGQRVLGVLPADSSFSIIKEWLEREIAAADL